MAMHFNKIELALDTHRMFVGGHPISVLWRGRASKETSSATEFFNLLKGTIIAESRTR
jgi:hypothetical protein